MNLKLDLRVRLHLLEHVHAAAAAIALELIGAIGDVLQFLQNKARHDQLGVDNPRITNIGNPAVDNYAGVEHEWAAAFNLFGEFDIGNDEAEFVLRLQQGRNREIAANDGDQQAQRLQQILPGSQERLQGHREKRAEQQAEQQAKVDRRNGGDLFIANEDVADHNADADGQNGDKGDDTHARVVLVLWVAEVNQGECRHADDESDKNAAQ